MVVEEEALVVEPVEVADPLSGAIPPRMTEKATTIRKEVRQRPFSCVRVTRKDDNDDNYCGWLIAGRRMYY